MKTIEKTLYTLAELKTQFPDGYKRALQRHEKRADSDGCVPWQDEIMESLKAVFAAAGVEMGGRWSVGPYSRSTYIRADFPGEYGDETKALNGPRAMAWLENNLIGPLRTPWRGLKRWRVTKYGRDYRAGRVKPCPFTGYCADDDFLDSLREDIRTGSTLGEAFGALAGKAAAMMESECEYQRSEDAFNEMDDGEEKYLDDGSED